MRKIPTKLRNEIVTSKKNTCCAICGDKNNIEWHHVWIYAGRQINEPWAIVGACKEHHERVTREPLIKEQFEMISLLRATEHDLAKYPKKDWQQIKRYLEII